jgi:hypothetical protein
MFKMIVSFLFTFNVLHAAEPIHLWEMTPEYVYYRAKLIDACVYRIETELERTDGIDLLAIKLELNVIKSCLHHKIY